MNKYEEVYNSYKGEKKETPVKSKDFSVYSYMSPVTTNAGYTHIGDNQGNKTLLITKDGLTLKLNEPEIKELLSNLSFFDPRLR